MNTPIDRCASSQLLERLSLTESRFIPEHMTEKSVKERLEKLMETDWRSLAEETLKKNMKAVERGEEAYVSVINFISFARVI